MNSDSYSTITGWVTIVAHCTPDAHAYNSPDPVEIRFDFQPDDPSAADQYRFPDVADADQRLTVGAGANPSRSWVDDKGLEPGSRHRCTRRELRSGVGPPVLFHFPDLETKE